MKSANERGFRISPLNQQPECVTWARERADMTKTELAARTGIALSLISEIESGKRNATPRNLRKIARALNCPLPALERKRVAS